MIPGKITVVVVNWNGRALLGRCLPALLAQDYYSFDITVVDNGSTDSSAYWLKEYFPSIKLISNPANIGFAAASNQGILAGDGEWVATLNNDAFPDPTWLGELVAAGSSSTRIGMVASLMLRPGLSQVVDSAGLCVDRAGLAWDRFGGLPVESVPTAVSSVFGACAGAALYRRAMLEEVGLFEPSFFAYLEDVDLAWRARLRGWEARFAPDARVYHQHSGTLGEGSASKRYLLGRNKYRLLVRNYPWPALAAYLPALFFYDTLAVLGALVLPTPDGLAGRTAPLRGRLASLAELGAIWHERRAIQRQARARSVSALGLSPLAGPRTVARRYAYLWSKAAPSGIIAG